MGDIEWVLNYYITECTGNSIFGDKIRASG